MNLLVLIIGMPAVELSLLFGVYSRFMKIVYRQDPSGPWMLRDNPVRVYKTRTPEELSPLLDRVERETRTEHLFAAGFILYEAAGAFNPRFRHFPEPDNLPLAQFALYKEDEYRELPEVSSIGNDFQVSSLIPEISHEQYSAAFGRVREHIRQGNTYQINLTFRLRARFAGDPFAWFCARASAGHGKYCLYLEDDDFALASLSPELFFEYTGSPVKTLTMKPMKGTAPRTGDDDSLSARALSEDPKNCAENLMITDMIRNDAGMIALPGTVRVPALHETEIFPTLIQMTSTVTAETASSLGGVFSALFPCASITGTPKLRSTEIIHACETSPRGIYTGTIGMIRADGSGQFNVAIRTACFNKKTRMLYYGTGSGITWNSTSESEWEECMTKTRVAREQEPFYVYESLLLEDGELFLGERHLSRFTRSVLFFELVRDEASFRREMQQILETISVEHPLGAFKVRIRFFGPDRETDYSCDPVPALPDPYTIALSRIRTDTTTVFSPHKTSNRSHLERALESVPDASDVIILNERGELAESSRANIVLELSGRKYTPPLSAGILPGVFREELLAAGEIEERALYPADYDKADTVYIINSVRRFVPCVRLESGSL